MHLKQCFWLIQDDLLQRDRNIASSNACLLSAADVNWESPATWAALHLSHLLPLAKLKSACLAPLWREKLHSRLVLYTSMDAGFIFYHFWQMQRSNSWFWISSMQYMYKLKSKNFGWIKNSNFLPLQTSWLTVSCWLTYLSLNGGWGDVIVFSLRGWWEQKTEEIYIKKKKVQHNDFKALLLSEWLLCLSECNTLTVSPPLTVVFLQLV